MAKQHDMHKLPEGVNGEDNFYASIRIGGGGENVVRQQCCLFSQESGWWVTELFSWSSFQFHKKSIAQDHERYYWEQGLDYPTLEHFLCPTVLVVAVGEFWCIAVTVLSF